MKRRTAKLSVIAIAVAYASSALSATSEREASASSQDTPAGIQLAKGSPASKMFGNPFKSPSDTAIDFDPTGSISKAQPAANGKMDESPSVTPPPAKKRN
jgi:hypothetical protein